MNRTPAVASALAAFVGALLVAHSLADRGRERELAAERRRAEEMGAPFVARLATRIGWLEAEACFLALAPRMPPTGKPFQAELAEGYQTWLVDTAGQPLSSASNARYPTLPAAGWALLSRADPAEPPSLLGPLPGPAGEQVLVAVAPIRSDRRARPGVWVALAADVRALAAPIGLEALLAAGYDYDILVADSVSAPRKGLRGATTVLVAPVRLPVSLGTGLVELALAPRDGWRTARAPNVAFLFGFLLSTLLAIAAYEIARLPRRLRQEATVRFGQLESANRRLLEAVQRYQERDRQVEVTLSRDAVTGLPSRTYFLERLERALSRVRATPGSGFAVLLVGIEGVRQIVDSQGPEARDRLLTAMAQRLDRAMRPGDTVARVGDDAFAVLLYDVTTPETATKAARRIREPLNAPLPVDGRELFALPWIGIELSRSGYERPEEMLRHAEMAMERAKADGIAGTALFDPTFREQAAQRFQLESDLRLALDRQELRVVYQVVVSLESGAILGAVALIRWAHPLEGLLPPARFIGLAEDTGLIVPITRWVLREACRQLVEWRSDQALPPAFYVSVNLSARDLQDHTLCEHIRDLLHETGIPPGALRVEVTEGMLMADVRAAGEVIEGLRGLQIPILLDDFGTGYSSLSYLQRFPLDVLKIDRTFVRDIVTNERDRNLVRAIVQLAADLGMRTIAEGIDDEAQIEVLRGLRCEFGQGFHFGKPVAAASISDQLAVAMR